MIAWFVSGLAGAVPPSGGVQITVLPPVMELLEVRLEGEELAYFAELLEEDSGCYDTVGVRNFNLLIPVEEVSAELTEDGVSLALGLSTVAGYDMEVFGTSPGLDACPEFEGVVEVLTFSNAIFQVVLRIDSAPTATNSLAVEVVGTPILDGDLSVDLAADTPLDLWPDGVVLQRFEDEILDALVAGVATALPDAVEKALAEPITVGSRGSVALEVQLDDVLHTQDVIVVAASADLLWAGSTDCVPAEPGDGPSGIAPVLAIDPLQTGALGISLTQPLVDHALWSLWRDGFFCFQSDSEAVAALLPPELVDVPGGILVTASLAESPVARLEPDGIELSLSRVNVQISGDGITLLSLTADVWARLLLELDPAHNAIIPSLKEVAVDVRELDSAHWLTDSEAEDRLVGFLERRGPLLFEAIDPGLAVPAVMHSKGTWFRVDRLVAEASRLTVWASAFAEDAPEVDHVPPDTTVTAGVASRGSVVLTFAGSDDAGMESLVYRWRVDGRPWSSWKEEQTVELALGASVQTVEVVARDKWFNEDPTPAVLELGPIGEPSGRCDTGAAALGGWVAAFGWSFVIRRRKFRPTGLHPGAVGVVDHGASDCGAGALGGRHEGVAGRGALTTDSGAVGVGRRLPFPCRTGERIGEGRARLRDAARLR